MTGQCPMLVCLSSPSHTWPSPPPPLLIHPELLQLPLASALLHACNTKGAK
jgi:hypothetical protein